MKIRNEIHTALTFLKKQNTEGAKPPLMARIIATACICFLLAATVIDLLPTNGEEAVYDNVVRLHVLAASDSAEDQAIKGKVRDAVLALLADTSDGACDKESAEQAYRARLDEIAACAAETVAAHGEAKPCRVTLTREYYPPRTYGSVTLPSGSYTSLRVLIGEAEGQNWWCVLFPPLCLQLAKADSEDVRAVYAEEDAGARAETEELLAAGFTPEQVAILTEKENPRVVIKFRIVEFFRELFAK